MDRFKRCWRIPVLALLLLCAQWARAGEPLTIMVGGIEKIIYLPAKLAEHLGYFTAAGLDVRLLTDRSGVHAADELLAGTVDAVVGFYDHTIDLQAKGKSVVAIVQLAHAPGEAVLAMTEQALTLKQLAARPLTNMGVTGLGSSTHFLSLYLLQTNGLKLQQIRFIPVGTGEPFVQALHNSQIDLGMTTEPTVSRLLMAKRAQVIVDLRTPEATASALGGMYPGACLYVQAAWLQRNPDKARRLAAALVQALQFIQSHEAREIADLMPETFYAGDKAAYVRAIASSKAIFTPDGRMPAAGPASVLRVLSQINRSIQGKPIDLARTYSLDYLPAAK